MANRPAAFQESTCDHGGRLVRLFALLAALSASAGEAFACGKDPSGRPTVGLVLSGGGALAASQVGAIKALEENGVPIHCIVGTSMGAVVGALYASGHDADELKKIFVDADWGTVATGVLPYREQGVRTKEDLRDFLSDYVIGIGPRGISLPSGLSSLRGMRRYLRHETGQVAHVTEFDRLPIPYRATATDLSTGEAVTLERGDLVDAALASMAVPGLYPSQVIEGRTLIDGGMSNQVPIGLAREMGADIVIVIDNTLPPPTFRDRAPSVVDTVMQLVNLQVWRNRQEQIKQLTPDDLLIQPDMEGYSTAGFDRVAEGYEVGYEAAAKQADRLRAIAAQAAPARPQASGPPEAIAIASIGVSAASGIDEKLIRDRFGIKPGDTVTRGELYAGLDDVASLDAFDSVDYQLDPGDNGANLDLVTEPRGEGKQHLQFGVKLSTTLDGDDYYGLLGRWSYKPLNAFAGEINVTTEIGTNLLLDVEWVQPVGHAGRYFVESGVAYARRTLPVNVDEVRLAERRNDSASVRVNVGREFGHWGLVSIGGFAAALDSDVRVGDTLGVGAESGDYLGLNARFAADTFNTPSFPISGQGMDLNISHYNDSSRDIGADVGTLRLASAQKVGDFGTFVAYEGGVLTDVGAGLPLFTLGGFKYLSGFEVNSVPASSYNFLRLEGFTRLGAKVEESFGLPVYVGATLEAADVRLDLPGSPFENDFYAGSIYGAVRTPLGPAYLAFGMGESGRNSIYFHFGRGF